MPIKMTMRNQIPPVRMAVLKSTNNKCRSEFGVRGSLLHCWWQCALPTTTIKDNVCWIKAIKTLSLGSDIIIAGLILSYLKCRKFYFHIWNIQLHFQLWFSYIKFAPNFSFMKYIKFSFTYEICTYIFTYEIYKILYSYMKYVPIFTSVNYRKFFHI